MSVYKPKQSRLWHYDFVLKGRRFHGSTGQDGRRAAEAVERRFRLEAAEGRLDDAGGLTLDQAAGRWWLEVGEHLRDHTLQRRLLQLVKLIGPGVRLNDIETKHVNAAVQKRRGQGYRRSEEEGAKVYPVAARTVNKDVVNLLRRIHNRARKLWGAKGLHEIAWGELELPSPPDPIVYYTAAQRTAWLAECDELARVCLQILLTYGLRKGELFFPLDAFDPDGPRLVLNRRKAGANTVPLKAADAADIAARLGRARAAGLETVWFEEQLNRRTGELELKPLTYHGLTSRLRSAARRAEITIRGPIHGARHHAGTEALRRSKNIRTAGRLLGHADLKSTMRYAHALEDDVLSALGDDASKLALGEQGPAAREA